MIEETQHYELSKPVFGSGEPVDIRVLNENFDVIDETMHSHEESIDDHEGRISEAEGAIETHSGAIEANTTAISDNAIAISDNASAIESIESAIEVIQEAMTLLENVMHWRDAVDTVGLLPDDAMPGDVYHVNADGSEWAWNGSEWKELGTFVDLAPYYTSDEVDELIAESSGGLRWNSTAKCIEYWTED